MTMSLDAVADWHGPSENGAGALPTGADRVDARPRRFTAVGRYFGRLCRVARLLLLFALAAVVIALDVGYLLSLVHAHVLAFDPSLHGPAGLVSLLIGVVGSAFLVYTASIARPKQALPGSVSAENGRSAQLTSPPETVPAARQQLASDALQPAAD